MTTLPRLLTLLMTLSVMSAASCGAALRPDLSMPSQSMLIEGYDRPDSIESRMSRRPLSAIEGLWELTGDGSLVAIERVAENSREATGVYRIVAVIAGDRSIEPGSLMGYAVDGGQRGHYDCRIYTAANSGKLHKPQSFEMKIDGDGRLTLGRYREGIFVNLWRMLPYMFRYSIGKRDERPRHLDGMIRRYPINITTPIYL